MKPFFFDTADAQYIENAWGSLSQHFQPTDVVGVTTNPNAVMKANLTNMKELEDRVRELCRLVTSIRGGHAGGVVYIQHPDSNVSPLDLVNWVRKVVSFTDHTTKVGIKIPPYKRILEAVSELRWLADINVTGVADCATALNAFSYDVRYVSIIPGRMEEAGIDAKAQIHYVNQRKRALRSRMEQPPETQEIITGSMRTLEGLQWVIQYGTVPTIGTRVFDLILNGKEKQFSEMWEGGVVRADLPFAPLIDQRNTDLSIAFFKQMDECGSKFSL